MFYADINGSSPIYPIVEEKINQLLLEKMYANPNAIHKLGNYLHDKIENARNSIAQILDASVEQIIFNSGASEGISHIFHSIFDPLRIENNFSKRIVVSTIEHACVLAAAKYYEKIGFGVDYINANKDGVICIDELQEVLSKNQDNTALVCIMAANNETGVIQPITQISSLCQEYNIPYFSDTTQYIGKTDFSFKKSQLDYAVCSSHKIGSLIGSGFILVKDPKQKNHNLSNFIFGGGQENFNRGGTQNYIGVLAMEEALKYFDENKQHLKGLALNRDKFEENLKNCFEGLTIFGKKSPRLAGTSFWGVPQISGMLIQEKLQSDQIYVSTTSACCESSQRGSMVLQKMGYDSKQALSAVRTSFCLSHTDDDFSYLLQKIKKIK